MEGLSSFKDLFSDASSKYAAFRPHYPNELFAFLATCCSEKKIAWDCATGNGQAAAHLSRFFDRVIATDPSAQQLAEAKQVVNIEYRQETAEKPSLSDNSVDAITIAQALHWFDWNQFYSQVNRVLKADGVIMAIAYGFPEISPSVDELIMHLHNVTLREYWEQERPLVVDMYKDIPFPFERIDAPPFFIRKEMTQADLLGYLATWSGLKKYITVEQKNPIDLFASKLNDVWPKEHRVLNVSWPLAIKVGKKPTKLL